MELAVALAVASVVPIAAISWWLFGMRKGQRAAAGSRYRVAMNLLIYGIISPVAFVPLAFVTYGQPSAYWAMTYLFSGLLSILTAGAMGLVNLLLLKRLGAISSLYKEI